MLPVKPPLTGAAAYRTVLYVERARTASHGRIVPTHPSVRALGSWTVIACRTMVANISSQLLPRSMSVVGAALAATLFSTMQEVRAQQPTGLVYGHVARVTSLALKEERQLNIWLPTRYPLGTERYPVIFLLDGSADEDYFHVAGLVDFLATYDVMAPAIVVGIANVDRRRDFTSPSTDPADLKAAPTSGGAAAFVRALEFDLIPYVAKHYRTNGARTLIGQSLGGLLATQVLIERPHLFADYVIVSPSLWWNRQAMLEGAAAALKAPPSAHQRVYVSVADEPAEMTEAAARLVALIRKLRPESLCVHEQLPLETHATSLHISVYNAMRVFHRRPQ